MTSLQFTELYQSLCHLYPSPANHRHGWAFTIIIGANDRVECTFFPEYSRVLIMRKWMDVRGQWLADKLYNGYVGLGKSPKKFIAQVVTGQLWAA